MWQQKMGKGNINVSLLEISKKYGIVLQENEETDQNNEMYF